MEAKECSLTSLSSMTQSVNLPKSHRPSFAYVYTFAAQLNPSSVQNILSSAFVNDRHLTHLWENVGHREIGTIPMVFGVGQKVFSSGS